MEIAMRGLLSNPAATAILTVLAFAALVGTFVSDPLIIPMRITFMLITVALFAIAAVASVAWHKRRHPPMEQGRLKRSF